MHVNGGTHHCVMIIGAGTFAIIVGCVEDPEDEDTNTFNSPVLTPMNDHSGDASFLCTSSTGWKVFLFGQALSFLLASGGAAQATLHFQCNLSAPTFASSIIYLLLSLNLIPLYLRERRNKLLHRSSDVNDTESDSVVMMQQQSQIHHATHFAMCFHSRLLHGPILALPF